MNALFRILGTLAVAHCAITLAEDGPAPGHSHAGEAFNTGPRQAATKLDGTGDVHFPITTTWGKGQAMFNQGIGQLHGFWYYEAERTFRQIAAEDPDCAMAYWGMAMANWENSGRARDFIAEAVERKDEATPHERLWIDAQAAFLGDEPKDIKERRKNLIKALENIIHEHPDDIEAKAFLVVRLWQFDRSGIPIGSHQAVDALLDQVFAVNPMHPAHHYRIHHWDSEKPERALGSAAVLHATAPSIAHMWHMPGHIYDKRKRYPESGYHQEASARVDHRLQAEKRVLPDTIHNYAHNNEWLIRNWNHVGRARDAITMAKGMVDNPMHPKLNHYGKSGSSVSYGRRRLFETLERFELWGEILDLAGSHYLEATDETGQQVERFLRMGRAQFELGARDPLVGARDGLRTIIAEIEMEKDKKTAEAEAKAAADGKDEKDTKKLVAEATRSANDQLKKYREAEAELATSLELLDGEPFDDDRVGKIKRDKSALARLHLRYGQAEKAKTLATEAADGAKNQVVPLAVQVHVLEATGDREAATSAFERLRKISAQFDREVPAFQRLAGVAERTGAPADWRSLEPWRDADFGDKPETLEQLGPLVYQAPDAPDFDLVGEDGNHVSLRDFTGRPVLLLLYIGHTCSHCVEQLNAFMPYHAEFEHAGIEIIAASPEPPEEVFLAHALCTDETPRFPFSLYSDPDRAAFKAYGAYDDFESIEMHGAFLIGPDGKLRWMDVGSEPFMDADFLLRESQRLLGM